MAFIKMDYKLKYTDEYKAIDKILTVLENNFRYSYGEKIPFDEVFEMMKDLRVLFNNFEKHVNETGFLATRRYIPILDLLVKVDKDKEHMVVYEQDLKNAYKLGARVSLEHYMVYREWDLPYKEKFFEPRYNIMKAYVYYLQEIVMNPKFEAIIANMPSGYGKLIANDIPVLTRNGWKKHGDLVVGDEVISPKGDFIKVTHVHPKRLANVKITFEDGEEILCHNQHEWQVYDRNAQKEKHIETNYMIGKVKEKDGKRNRFYIPLREVVKGEHKDLPVDPYTYGVWLGDGTNKQPRITQNNEDSIIFDYIPYQMTKTYKGVNDNVKTYNLKGLSKDLQKLGLCYQDKRVDKFIHDSYLTASIEQRLELLAGLLDTDGHLDKKKNRYIFVTAEETLKDSFISLVSTFDWRCSVTKVKPSTSTSGIKATRDTYYIGFNPTMFIPCKLERKQLHKFSKQRRIGISKIEFIRPTEGNCISVEGGLYLVGKTLKMTHNTYPEKISEAWGFGIDDTGTILSLCSNDAVVKGGSQSVKAEMMSEPFGEVFPHLKFDKNDKNYFLKSTDSEWKLKNCKLLASYYASTTNSNVVGERASARIHIDDLYADYKEALNQNLNQYYFNKSMTVWEKRFVQNKLAKKVITGTLWASGDYIDLMIQRYKKEENFHPHPKFKYCLINESETIAIIQVPALDYETGLSTCEELRSTREILREKNNMEDYIFQTNFQQIPTNPEQLFFAYDRLRVYKEIPATDSPASYAVIDATRKSGKDFFAMPIFKKIRNGDIFDYYLKDCLFTRTATKDMYDEVVNKIIQNHIVRLVIESNVTSELKQALDERLLQRGVTYCEIGEKYNCAVKSERIESEKGTIRRQMIFPEKGMYGVNSDMGQFMNNLTIYNSEGGNANDDACFEGNTLIATQFGNKKIKDIKVGDKVITPFGLRKVVESGMTGYKETINKFGLNVTKNHKVYNKTISKFTPIDRFTIANECDRLSLGGIIKWGTKLSYLMEKNTEEVKNLGITSNIRQEMKIGKIARNFIEQSGNITMEKSQMGIKFIIKTKILIIMTFLIWSVYQLGNIYHNIVKKIGKMKNIEKKQAKVCEEIPKDKKNVKNGIKVKKEKNGIDNMHLIHFLKIHLEKKENANGVEKNMLLKHRVQCTAQTNVNTKHVVIRKLKFAKFVEKNFIQQDMQQKPVHQNVKENCYTIKKPVYNIKVEGAGCYYANSILVSNCDSAAMFSSEIIEDRDISQKAIAVPSIRRYF